MADKTDTRQVDPVEDVLGGAGPRGETAACPTGLGEADPLKPDGNAIYRGDEDASAGSGDSAAWENVPSGEKKEATQQPQNAPVQPGGGGKR